MSVHRCDNGYYYPYGGDAFNNRVGVGPGEGFNVNLAWNGVSTYILTLLHSERPKLYTILAFLSAIGLNFSEF